MTSCEQTRRVSGRDTCHSWDFLQIPLLEQSTGSPSSHFLGKRIPLARDVSSFRPCLRRRLSRGSERERVCHHCSAFPFLGPIFGRRSGRRRRRSISPEATAAAVDSNFGGGGGGNKDARSMQLWRNMVESEVGDGDGGRKGGQNSSVRLPRPRRRLIFNQNRA